MIILAYSLLDLNIHCQSLILFPRRFIRYLVQSDETGLLFPFQVLNIVPVRDFFISNNFS